MCSKLDRLVTVTYCHLNEHTINILGHTSQPHRMKSVGPGLATLPLWQNITFWAIFGGFQLFSTNLNLLWLFLLLDKFEPTLALFVVGQIVVNGHILNK